VAAWRISPRDSISLLTAVTGISQSRVILLMLPQFVVCPVREFIQLAFKAFPFPTFFWPHCPPLPSVMFNAPSDRIQYEWQGITPGKLELVDNVTLERGR